MHKNPKTAHKNAQKKSENFKPCTHNVVSSGKKIRKKKYGFLCVLVGCFRFARNCGKMYSQHLFLYGGLCCRSASRHSGVEMGTSKYARKGGGGGGGYL